MPGPLLFGSLANAVTAPLVPSTRQMVPGCIARRGPELSGHELGTGRTGLQAIGQAVAVLVRPDDLNAVGRGGAEIDVRHTLALPVVERDAEHLADLGGGDLALDRRGRELTVGAGAEPREREDLGGRPLQVDEEVIERIGARWHGRLQRLDARKPGHDGIAACQACILCVGLGQAGAERSKERQGQSEPR